MPGDMTASVTRGELQADRVAFEDRLEQKLALWADVIVKELEELGRTLRADLTKQLVEQLAAQDRRFHDELVRHARASAEEQRGYLSVVDCRQEVHAEASAEACGASSLISGVLRRSRSGCAFSRLTTRWLRTRCQAAGARARRIDICFLVGNICSCVTASR